MDQKALHDKYLAALEEANTARTMADEADAAARAAHYAYLAAKREAEAAALDDPGVLSGTATIIVDESDDIEATKGQFAGRKGQFH